MILYHFVGHHIAKLFYRQRPGLSNLIGKYRVSNTNTVWNTQQFVYFQDEQANSENLCPPPRFFLRNKESSENVKFIRGVTLTRYILSTYVDSNNA